MVVVVVMVVEVPLTLEETQPTYLAAEEEVCQGREAMLFVAVAVAVAAVPVTAE